MDERMDTQIIKVEPELYAQICPNCNGRGTVGFDRHPCPTCGSTDHPGIVYVPVRMNGRKDEGDER